MLLAFLGINLSLLKKLNVLRRPSIFTKYKNIVAAESLRTGGVSPAPFNSLNLGGATADQVENVIENNKRFFAALNIPFEQVAKSHQVHGNLVLNVMKPGRYEGYDALITNRRNIQLAVTIADCTPILIYDPINGAIAAIHAGWRGTVGNIVSGTISQMMVNFKTQPHDCIAFIGTCIDIDNFEVGIEVAEQFDKNFKVWNPDKQKFNVDLKMANRQLLLDAGLTINNIEVSSFSTVIDNDAYFSYRKENGLTGRMLATIGIL